MKRQRKGNKSGQQTTEGRKRKKEATGEKMERKKRGK